ncbi:ABC transporter ATP-binding protein [Spirillospora sp. CA-294931]|uniref:ABC transporter ATP-binding protein n=1 Tax=Spirillospora sp. CA-294931 TaxID=3240042 RepID=UPI003D93DED7
MLRVERLGKSYGDRAALSEVTFDVRPGEMFGFVGANGAGKTTTMRIIMGVLAADAGRVTWRGAELTRTRRRAFGYMPEERGLYQKMKVAEQIEYFGRQYGLSAAASRRATGEWIERLGLTERRDDQVQALSLGNQQRTQLAVALVHDPEVLVLDEPFSGLDPIGVDALADVLAEKRDAGVPVVFSSHQLDLVERLSDAVGIIKAGRMVAAGTVDEVRAREGRRLLRVGLRDAAPGWAERLPGTVVGTPSRGHALVEPNGHDDQDILSAALKEGRLEHFGWELPTLSEIFREVVA